jgi:hypothetical protein
MESACAGDNEIHRLQHGKASHVPFCFVVKCHGDTTLLPTGHFRHVQDNLRKKCTKTPER